MKAYFTIKRKNNSVFSFEEKFRSWSAQSNSLKDWNSMVTGCEMTLLVAFEAMFGEFIYQGSTLIRVCLSFQSRHYYYHTIFHI